MYIIKHRNLFFILPGVLVALSLAALLAFSLKGGVDLRGGALLEVSFIDARPSVEDVQSALGPILAEEIRVQPTGTQGYLIRTRTITNDEKNAIVQALANTSKSPVHEDRFTSIGPTIGKELRSRAWIAIVLVTLAIVLYITFAFRHVSKPVASWKYGVISIVTLLHDIIIPMGLFALLGYTHGAEVDSLFIVALLTILGISINDTIVVFDRIRENLRVNEDRSMREPFEATVGKSVDQTITRSINTSLTVIFALLSLYFLGPETTKDFALTLTIGMIAGTYSSIFLASPLLVVWDKFSRKAK